jgi:TRAP-type C4-dicarboxylate transport system substrate-binding protein
MAIIRLIHGVAEKFAEKVRQSTNGAVTISIRPASQLFNLRTSAEALQLGTLDMCWTDLGTLGNWQPQFGFVSLPFLFNNYDHVKKSCNSRSQQVRTAKILGVRCSPRPGLGSSCQEADPDRRTCGLAARA